MKWSAGRRKIVTGDRQGQNYLLNTQKLCKMAVAVFDIFTVVALFQRFISEAALAFWVYLFSRDL